MEESDYKALDHPQEYIIDKGGHIFIALEDSTPVGTAALVKMPEADNYELAKMSVTDRLQGKGVGRLLMNAVIDKATNDLSAKRIYIESNRSLGPAIALYKSAGFVEIDGGASPYKRCNIWLEKWLCEREESEQDQAGEEEGRSTARRHC